MSMTTLTTRHLLGLLADLERTAGTDPDVPLLSAVLLHTDHGLWTFTKHDTPDPALLDEVPTDLLVGTSTDGSMVAHAHAPTEGRLHTPLLVALADVKALIRFLRPFGGRGGRTSPSLATLELTGDTLTVTETPSGRSMRMTIMDDADYPRNLSVVLQPESTVLVGLIRDQDGMVIPASYGTGLNPMHLAVGAAVGKRRKMPVRWYRFHQNQPIVMEVGAAYRCVFPPAPLEESTWEHREPQVPVFVPPLSARSAEAFRPLELADLHCVDQNISSV